jgi:hypothetical protein
MEIAGYGVGLIFRNLGFHFLLGFIVSFLVSSLVLFIGGKKQNFKFSIFVALSGGLAGVLMDIDHFWGRMGRRWHIPIMTVWSFSVIIYIFVFGKKKNTYNFAIMLALWASIAAHVVEDYQLSWF